MPFINAPVHTEQIVLSQIVNVFELLFLLLLNITYDFIPKLKQRMGGKSG